MGSVTNYDDKCPHCGCNNLFSDYQYNTGEYACSCNACGMGRLAYFKREYDGNGVRIVTRDVEYPIDGTLVMAVKAYRPAKEWYNGEIPYDNLPKENTILWETPITTDMTFKDIHDFLFPEAKAKYESIDSSIDCKALVELNPMYIDSYNIKYGIKNLFHKVNSAYKQLWYIGNNFRLETNSDGKPRFIMEEAVWDVHDNGGYGVIAIWGKPDKDGKCKEIYSEYFDKSSYAGDMLSIWNNHITNGFDNTSSYLTIWDEQKKELICLKGTIPNTNFLNGEGGI